ncbi:hypothetical protein TWF481_000499 [Arthrobotrys musiformis]|uniref:Something about silencing protein 4 domain-containing protein n=1 Tax=Arthrobotrys musiformis TaxID=47236 RepID=A0AAV9WNW3_9PEZI
MGDPDNSRSGGKSKNNTPETSELYEQPLSQDEVLGSVPTFLPDTPANRVKFGHFLPISPTSPGRKYLSQFSGFPSSSEKSDVDDDGSMLPSSSPPAFDIDTPTKAPVGKDNDPTPGDGASDWHKSDFWTREKATEQENRARKLIGDLNHIKATLEYYCANDARHHAKWVRILADHILLLSEARGMQVNVDVAYHVAQQRASKYRQHLEASTLESEAKRAYDEDTEKNKKGSLRGKSKIPRTEEASISKGTHPMNKKGSGRKSLPLASGDNNGDEINFRLIGANDFLGTLKMSKAKQEEYLPLFVELRDDIWKGIQNPGKPETPRWPESPNPGSGASGGTN